MAPIPFDHPVSLHEITAAVDYLFCSPRSARFGPYRRIGDGTEYLPNRLYRYSMLTAADEPVSLQIYSGLNELGGQLWEQEARVLLRLTARGHPALPRILDGGYDEDRNLGFVVTESADLTLASEVAMRELRERKPDCIRFLAQLTDALSLLHGQGVMHRTLNPIAIAAVSSTPDRIDRLRLERFEMSGLITNVLRRHHWDEASADAEARRLLRKQDPRGWAYFPPERVGLLDPIGAPQGVGYENDRSDVYGLGVLGWELFIGPMPPALLNGTDVGTLGWARRLNDHLRSELRRAALPRPLTDLLAEMLDPDGRTRITSVQAVDYIAKHYDILTGAWESSDSGKPFLVLFQSIYSGPTVYEWGWIAHSPEQPEGKVELRTFLEDELRGASLVYSEDGARPYVPPGKGKDNRVEARHVLLGRCGAWFCTPYQDRSSGRVRDEAIIIKYVAKREKTSLLNAQQSVRRVSSVDARDWSIGSRALEDEYRDRPSWRPLFDAVRPEVSRKPWHQSFGRAIDWLLDLQLVELRAREYPFTAEVTGNTAILRYDAARDRTRIDKHRDPIRREPSMLFRLYASKQSLRKEFAQFFTQGGEEDENDGLEFIPEEEGQLNYSRAVTGWFREALDDRTIRVSRRAGESNPIPRIGWVRLVGSRYDFESHKRQLEARDELMESVGLIDQFDSPTVVRGYRHRWREAGNDLEGDSAEVVRSLLASQPFFAIHGPPGTGKSTIAAAALCAYLAAERSARILVSAQSHCAVDRLAIKILKSLEKRKQRTLFLRIASREGEAKVAPRIRDYLPAKVVERLMRELRVECERRLQEREYGDRVKAVLGQWRAYLPNAGPELYDRIRRGASLVFSTCAGATRDKVDAVGSFGVYDWVVVEEAAKAWPTELALPLVRGLRWTEIGDYKQMPAYRRQEVEELLASCATSDDPNLKIHGDFQSEYRRVFSLFESLFAPRGRRPDRTGELARPLARLAVQYRMRRAIADVVSEAFYADVGGLKTAPSAEDRKLRITSPGWLAGRPLVWIDTAGVDDCVNQQSDKGSWWNAGEARLVAELIEALQPPVTELDHDEDEDPLAVLTPYRAQVDALRKLLPPAARSMVWTPHEYQGHEANVVICSLVRDKSLGASERQKFGHLAQPELVNVMFSRAKGLLVVVGRFDYYRDSGIDFWQVACETVRREGLVRSAGETR